MGGQAHLAVRILRSASGCGVFAPTFVSFRRLHQAPAGSPNGQMGTLPAVQCGAGRRGVCMTGGWVGGLLWLRANGDAPWAQAAHASRNFLRAASSFSASFVPPLPFSKNSQTRLYSLSMLSLPSASFCQERDEGPHGGVAPRGDIFSL